MHKSALRSSRFITGPFICGLRYNSQCHVSLPFQRDDWLVRVKQQGQPLKSRAKHLDYTQVKKLYPNLADVTDMEKFCNVLNVALDNVRSNDVSSVNRQELKLKKKALEQLFDVLYEQMKNYKCPKDYKLSLNEALLPSDTSELLPQLLHTHTLTDVQWQSILGKPIFFLQDIFTYILRNFYNIIYYDQLLPHSISSLLSKEKGLDISNPSEWFPEARKLKRTIVMHLGPTNSGKTYNALEKLKKCNRGYYAGPLRLLAREVYERFKHENLRCNLLTGEEIIDDLDPMGNKSGLTSGTVEMIPLNQEFEMVVLDEIQMMADEQRGWAWTNAFLGARASEIHLCGERSVLPLIKRLVSITGDNLVVNEYSRLGKLIVEQKPLQNGLKSLRKGDCLISFSKRKILDLKLRIEKETTFKVSVIYGSLPPETRVKQANMFNSGDSDILVASDAVGMGLNLSIKRVVFTESTKWNGTELLPLEDSNIKQIGGRAGRYKVAADVDNNYSPVGYVTALNHDILQVVRQGLEAPIKYLESAVTWPSDDIITSLMSRYPSGTQFSTLLEHFNADVKVESHNLYTLSDISKRIDVIKEYENVDGLSLMDLIRLSYAPVKDTALSRKTFVSFCETIGKKRTKSLLDFGLSLSSLDSKFIKDERMSLESYEELHHIIVLYMWLHIRYPEYFIDFESAYDLRNYCEYVIFEKLEMLRRNPYSRGGYGGNHGLSNKRSRVNRVH